VCPVLASNMAVSAKEIADVIRSKRDDFLREKEYDMPRLSLQFLVGALY
jgi:hypothetical protein